MRAGYDLEPMRGRNRASRQVVALGMCLFLSGCNYVPPGTTSQNHFKTTIPAGIKVEHYYCDAYKDPQFLWVTSPLQQPFITALIANGRLKPVAAGETITPLGGVPGLKWWNHDAIERIPEVYYRDPDANDGSYYRVWVDRQHNKVYILFMNT